MERLKKNREKEQQKTKESKTRTPTLIVETVDTVDAGALVVTTENEKVLGVLDLVGEEEADGLKALLAAVHVITKEEII